MKQPLRLLDQARIASPCPMLWEDLEGNSRIRYCGQCRLNVYNLSEMTDDEAEALLRSHVGRRLCSAYYKRQDGTILTKDCRGGLAIVRKRLFKLAAVTAAFMFGSLAIAISSIKGGAQEPDGRPANERVIEAARELPLIGPAVDKAFPQQSVGDMAIGVMPMSFSPSPGPAGSAPGAAPSDSPPR